MATPIANRFESAEPVSATIIKPAFARSSLATDASPSNPDVLRTLYAAMLKTRLLEERVLSLLRSGQIPGAPVPVLGGEATELGGCIGLQPDDTFASSQPRLSTDVVRGMPLKQVFARLFGFDKEYRTALPQDQVPAAHVVPQTATVAGQFNLAAGVALAYRQQGKADVVVTLADDGLAALGCWHEAASMASRQRLPLVFMVENCAPANGNGSASAAFKADEDLRHRADAYGFPGITVEGNDIVAVWRVTQESIHRARSGAGPTLIECRTWRWHAEAEPDLSSLGSKTKIAQTWKIHDPLHLMEHYMKKRSLWDGKTKDATVADYNGALDEAVAFAKGLTRRQ